MLITLHWGGFPKPLLPWKSNKCYIFVCACVPAFVRVRAYVCWCGCTGADVCLRQYSVTIPACNAPPYCHLRHEFRKIVIELKMCTLILSTTFIWNIFHSKKNSARCCHECWNVFIESARYSCRILTKLEFSRPIFEKSWNIKFYQNPPSGSRVVASIRTDRDRRTDGRTWRS